MEWTQKQLIQCGDYKSKWSWFPKRRRGRFFNLSLFWHSYYYHWICDVLTRLHTVLPRLTPDIQVVLPARMTAWQSRSLELIGLPLSQCVPYTGKRPWKVEHLFYASPVAMTGDHEKESLHWVRDTIWQRCLGRVPARAGWRKLYLARRNTASRNVINEAELLPLLQERGFEVVDCGTLNFDEQVRLFSEAACVAGPHGAALTNILWSPPGIKVFEIFEPSAVRRCYWSMCKTLGHHHACGIGHSVAQTKKEADIHVPVEDFIDVIEQLSPV
jgi:capsular polysaccharide biosynthesis protein